MSESDISEVNDASERSNSEPAQAARDESTGGAGADASEPPKDREAEDIAAIFSRMDLQRRKAHDAYEENVSRAEYDDNLREALSILQAPGDFSVGDLVQWKKFMQIAPYPHSGAPAIVVRFLDDPVLADKDSRRLPEPLDVVLGYLDGDNDFVTSHFVSSRFMRWD